MIFLSGLLFFNVFIFFLLIFSIVAIFMSRNDAEKGNQVTHESAAFTVVIVGLFILLVVYLLLIIQSIYMVATFVDDITNSLAGQFGYGTGFLLLLTFVFFFITLGFLIYVTTLIDRQVESGQTAREWAIACTITLGVAIVLFFMSLYFYYEF